MLSQTAVQHVPVTSDLLLCIRCVVLHVNETTWQGFLVWSAKQFWLKYRWSDQLLIIYTSSYTPQYPPYPLPRRVLWLQS